VALKPRATPLTEKDEDGAYILCKRLPGHLVSFFPRGEMHMQSNNEKGGWDSVPFPQKRKEKDAGCDSGGINLRGKTDTTTVYIDVKIRQRARSEVVLKTNGKIIRGGCLLRISSKIAVSFKFSSLCMS
jgi:hypothetical protein